MDRPSWPQSDPGKVLLHLDASCSVDTLFDCFFGSFCEFQTKLHKERGDSNMSESPWVLDRSKLPAEQFTWSSTTLGPAAGAAKAGAMRKVRFDAPPAPLAGKGFSNEEIQKVLDHAPGSHYRCESEVYTSAMYGDKFAILTRYLMVARGPGAAALHVTYTIVWSPALSGFLKPMIGKGVDGGIRGTFNMIRKLLAAQCAVVDRPESGPAPVLPGIAPPAAAAAELVPAAVPVPAGVPVAVAAGAGGSLGGALGLTDYLVYQELVAGLSGLPDPQLVVKALAVMAMLLLLGALVPLANTLVAPVQALCGRGAQGWVSSVCWPLGHVIDVPESVAEVMGALLLVWAANKLLVGGVALLADYLKQAAASRAAAAQRAATPAASRQPSLRTPSTTAQPAAAPPAAAGKGKAAPAAAAANGKAGGGRGRGKQKQGPLPADAGPAAHPLPRIESTASEDSPLRHLPTHSASAPVLVPAVPPAGMRRSDSAGAASNGASGAAFEAPMSSSPLGEGLQAITKVAGAMSTWGRSWLGGDLETMNSSSENLKSLFAGLGLRTTASESTSDAPTAPATAGAAAATAAAGGLEGTSSSEAAGGEPGHRRRSSGSSGGAGRPKGRHGHQPSFTTLIHDPSGFNIIEDYAQTSAEAGGEEGEGEEEDDNVLSHRLLSLDEEAASKVSSRASSPDKGGLLPIPSKTSSKGSSRSRTPSPDKQLAAGGRSLSKKRQGNNSSTPDGAKGGVRSASPGLPVQKSASSIASSSRPGRNKSPGPWGRANSLGDSLDAISTGLPEEEEGDVVDAEVFEYERHQPFRGWGHTWPGHFLPSDKVGHWGDRIGLPAGQASELFERVAPRLPIGWVWAEPQWEVDMMPLDYDGVDGEGWSYGVDFSWLVWPPQQGMGKAGYKDWTRRRRWIRRRVRVSSLGDDAKVTPGPDGQPMVVLPRASNAGRLTLNSEAVRRAAGVGSHGGDRPLHVTLSSKSVPADMVFQAGGSRYVDSSDEETEEPEGQEQPDEGMTDASPTAAAAADEDAADEEEGDADAAGSRVLAQSLSENALSMRPEQPKAATAANGSRHASPNKRVGKGPAATTAAGAAAAAGELVTTPNEAPAAEVPQGGAAAASDGATGDQQPAESEEQPETGHRKKQHKHQKHKPPHQQQQPEQQEGRGDDRESPSKASGTKAVAGAAAEEAVSGAVSTAPSSSQTYGVASAADEAAEAAAESQPAKASQQSEAAATAMTSSSRHDSKRRASQQHTPAATGTNSSSSSGDTASTGSAAASAAPAGGQQVGSQAVTSHTHGDKAGASVPDSSGATTGASSSSSSSNGVSAAVQPTAATGATDPLMGAAVPAAAPVAGPTSGSSPPAAAAGIAAARQGSRELPGAAKGVVARSAGPSLGSGDWVWSSAEPGPAPAVNPPATSTAGAAASTAGGSPSSAGGTQSGAQGSAGAGSSPGTSAGSSSGTAAGAGGLKQQQPPPGVSSGGAGAPHSPTAAAAGAHRLRISTSQAGSISSSSRDGAGAPAGGISSSSSAAMGGASSPSSGAGTHVRGALVSQRSQDSVGGQTGPPRVLTSRTSIGSAGSAGSPRLKEGRLSLSGGTPNKNHMEEWQQW